MVNKKLCASLLCALTLFSSIPFSVPVYAAGDSTATNFSVDSSVLGGSLVVVVPDNVNLTKNGEVFTGTGKVYAEGVTSPTKMISVSTDETVTYTNQSKDSITVDASVTFGTNGVATWDATTLKDNIDIEAEADKVGYDITSTVQVSDIDYIGTYKTNILFNISLVENPNAVSIYMAYDYTDTPATYTDNTSVPYEIYEVDGQVAELTEWGTDYDDLASRHDYVVEADSANVVIPAQVEGNDVVNVQFDSFFANEDIATSISTVEVPATVKGVVLSEDAYLQSGSTTVITCENLRRMTDVEKNIPDNAKIRFKFINENGDVDYVEFFTYSGATSTKSVTGLSEYGIQYLKDNYNPTDTVDIVMPAMHPSGQPVTNMHFKNFGDANAVASELPYVSLSFPETYTTITGEWNGYYQGTNEFLATKLVALDFDGIEEISNDAFRECTYSALKSITIPASVQSIGWYAFLGCTAVETITFEEGVGNIDISPLAFYSAKEVYLPSTMTQFKLNGTSSYAQFRVNPNIIFWNNNNDVITSGGSSYCTSPVQFNNGIGTIDGKLTSCNSYDPETQTAYFTSESPRTVSGADNVFKHIVIDGAVTIPNWAFENTDADIAFTNASAITSIGKFAFTGKTLIGDIVLGDCVVGDGGFYKATIDTLDIRNATLESSSQIFGDDSSDASIKALYATDNQVCHYSSDYAEIENLYLEYTGTASGKTTKYNVTGAIYFTGSESEWNTFISDNTTNFADVTVYYNQTLPVIE